MIHIPPVHLRGRRAGHKFGAVRTERDGINFPSKLEARVYDVLVTAYERKEIVGFMRQPMFDTGGGSTYRADFIVFHLDGSCEIWDAKGKDTTAFRRAKVQVESRYPWIGEVLRITTPGQGHTRIQNIKRTHEPF